MSSVITPEQSLEIAHVLFLDIVSYSTLPMDEQTRLIATLQEIVENSEVFRTASANQTLVSLPTGDGMALAFFSSPESPVKCALQISAAIRAGSDLKLRMGIHSGPVFRVRDIKGSANIAGNGINLAQRVMDCGDSGHILLSSSIAETLNQTTTWAKCITELGEAEVKHGVKVRVFNLCVGEDGNRELPKKLQHVSTADSEKTISTAAPIAIASSGNGAAAAAVMAPAKPTPSTAAAPKQIAVLYKRGVQPDEELLKLLEKSFTDLGHKVFIDRHLTIGVEWAREIEKQVREADAIVPLLSAASIQSEMLAFEVQAAYEAAQQNAGKPRILPIRVNYEGPLSTALAGFLDSIQYAVWHDSSDNDRIVQELVQGLEDKQVKKTAVPKQLESVGGAVPLDSTFYVERSIDAEFRSAIERGESIVLVKGARQMGKTSLLARGMQNARKAGERVVLTDFQKLNRVHLESPAGFFLALAELLAEQLDLDIEPQQFWSERRGPSANFERFLRKEILARIESRLVWGLDEVDRLFTCNFGSEVFGLFRSWHNERSLDPDGPWKRLTLAIAYATEAHLFITDINQSPFNVGVRLEVADFTFEQITELNRRYGSPLSPPEVSRLFRLFGGHPLLIRRSLHELASGKSLTEFEAIAEKDEGPFGDHLRRIIVLMSQDQGLCQVVRDLLQGGTSVSNDSFYRLRSAGLIVGDSPQQVKFRCQLYANYLEGHLL